MLSLLIVVRVAGLVVVEANGSACGEDHREVVGIVELGLLANLAEPHIAVAVRHDEDEEQPDAIG